MLDGARVLVCARVPVRPGSSRKITVEDEYVVKSFRRVLPEGETDDGGYREEPLLQFYARNGGLRTVTKSSILDIR
jgi:hypothetical protein